MAELRDIQNVKELIICPVCLDSLQHPKILPCGHSFCVECLAQHISSQRTPQNTFNCPSCRNVIRIRGTSQTDRDVAESFPNNSLLEGIREQLHTHESSAATCDTHRGSPAEYLCIPHAEFLCGKCAVRTHRERKCEIVAVSDATVDLQKEIRKLEEQNKRSTQEVRSLLTHDFKQKHLEDIRSITLKELQDFEKRIGMFYQGILNDIDKANDDLKNIQLPQSYDSDILTLLNKWQVEKFHLEKMCTDSNIPASFKAVEDMSYEHCIVSDKMKKINTSILVKNEVVKNLLKMRGSVVHLDKEFNKRYSIEFKKIDEPLCVVL